MTFRLDETTRAKIDANPYFMDRYEGETANGKLLLFIAWLVIIAFFVAIAAFDFNGHRVLAVSTATFFSWIPVLFFYEYRQLKKYETTGEPPQTLF